jgi:hypothetical protein
MVTQPAKQTVELTDVKVKRLHVPATGNVIVWDTKVTGLGARVTASGHRAFVLNYYTRGGQRRRFTLGHFPIGALLALARKRASSSGESIRAATPWPSMRPNVRLRPSTI